MQIHVHINNKSEVNKTVTYHITMNGEKTSCLIKMVNKIILI